MKNGFSATTEFKSGIGNQADTERNQNESTQNISWKTPNEVKTVGAHRHRTNHYKKERKKERKKKRKKDTLTSFKRPKWPIRPNKRLHLKC